MSLTLYEILNILPSSSIDTIKESYKKLVVIYHPDKLILNSTSYENSIDFILIQKAYNILKDPILRLEYDNELNNLPDLPAYNTITLNELEKSEDNILYWTCRCSDIVEVDLKHEIYPCNSCGLYIRITR